MKFELTDDQIDQIIIQELKQQLKTIKKDRKDAWHPDDRKDAKKLYPAMKRVLKYYGG